MIAQDTISDARTQFEDARRAMIDSQLRTSGVNDPAVLARFASVPREEFVPEAQRAAAYSDRALRLPEGGVLPAPLFHGMLLTEARPSSADRAIVIDGGSGYLAALITPMVASIETISPADGAAGKFRNRSVTLLLIDGAVEHLPEALTKKLPEGARLVTGLIERGVTRLAVGRKAGSSLGLIPLAELGVPRLTAFDREAGWSF